MRKGIGWLLGGLVLALIGVAAMPAASETATPGQAAAGGSRS